MKYIYIGKLVNTHALKGEVRIISNFDYKDRVFKSGFVLYLGPYKNPEVIETYRTHKQYDMVKFKGIDYINDVLKYKGNAVYVNEEDIVLDDDEILESELVGVEVYNDEVLVGTISEYRSDNGNRMIRVNDMLIPYNEDFITKVSRSERKIYMSNIGVFL